MYTQFVELVIFAGVAFFIITKLVSILGTDSEEESGKNKGSYFGEPSKLKDVTGTGKIKIKNVLSSSFVYKKKNLDLDDIIVEGCEQSVLEGLNKVTQHLYDFQPHKFIKGAKSAFKMIINDVSDQENLEALIDKRYIEQFNYISLSYGKCTVNDDKISAKISEIYMFGNNVFIKVLFTGTNITSKINDLSEEWTFSKSALSEGSEWYLSNIDRPQ